MAGPKGARCTTELKKKVRFAFGRASDINIFGFTSDERARINDFVFHNPELYCDWILRDNWINKNDCLTILQNAGINLPVMYALGFEHNNCLGCVKATSPSYWNRIRKHFPAIFAKRVRQSQELNVKLVRLKGVRISLADLPPEVGLDEPDGNIECGPFCAIPNP